MTTWTNQDRSGAEEKGTYLVTSGTDVLLTSGTDKLLLNASVEQELTTTWTNQPKS